MQLRKHVKSFGTRVDLKEQPLGPMARGKGRSKNKPQFDLQTELYRITGIGN